MPVRPNFAMPLALTLAAPLGFAQTSTAPDLAPWTVLGGQPCGFGSWEPPYDHKVHTFPTPPLPSPIGGLFNAVHMSVIASGPHQGKVLVWDRAFDTAAAAKQRWSIVDPRPIGDATFLNFELAMPSGAGDLFCAGHTWTNAGRLFVAGGTSVYPTPDADQRDQDGSFGFVGGKLCYEYDPSLGPAGTWVRQPDLAETRWYPTVVHTGNDELLVVGGVGDTDGHFKNSYEVFDSAQSAWKVYGGSRLLDGPLVEAAKLDFYPRASWLSDGRLFVSGMDACSARLDHGAAPGVWETMDCGAPWYLDYNSAVHLGNDLVMRVGGELELDGVAHGHVSLAQTCTATAAGAAWTWTDRATMQQERSQFNTVLLPDGSVLALGGVRSAPLHVTELLTRPELLPSPGAPWLPMADAASVRPYHSTAVLLPNGKVLSGGGDDRHYDYQVFQPPYLTCGAPRPVIANAPALIGYATGARPTEYTLEIGASLAAPITTLVLMAPGSVTHHSDSNQRRVVLSLLAVSATSATFTGPPSSNHAPAGAYMLFALTAQGVPSLARWVRLQ
jgi:Domain of unknown function (DUF1929)